MSGQNTINFLSGWRLRVPFLLTLSFSFFSKTTKMPIYNEAHKCFYSTRAETLKIFRNEEKKSANAE